MSKELIFIVGDLVHYVGPPLISPLNWELIIANNNGIVSDDDLGVVVKSDHFLRIADVFFQENEILVNRISFKNLIFAI